MIASYWRLPSSNVAPPLLSSKSISSVKNGSMSRRPSVTSNNGSSSSNGGGVAVASSPIAGQSRLRSHGSSSNSDMKLAAMLEDDDITVRRIMIGGAASVGKSTLMRQLSRLIQSDLTTPTSTPLMMDVSIIRSHIILVLKTIAMLAMGHDRAAVDTAARLVRSATSITDEVVSAVNILWADASVQADRAHSPSLVLANAQYFIDALPRVCNVHLHNPAPCICVQWCVCNSWLQRIMCQPFKINCVLINQHWLYLTPNGKSIHILVALQQHRRRHH
jgi:hypothetical protein